MNIIFGTRRAQEIGLRHIVLELDTFSFNDSAPLTSYCVVEHVPVDTLPNADKMVKIHEDLIQCFQEQKWGIALELIEELMGAWGPEMDTFYVHLKHKINELSSAPQESWTPIIQRQLH